ncbi:MAG: cob(I)yrinic acid a,c-diamide adenosyltransferase [Methanomassiliicoccaceae archaeon]|jgi:cob(I)alamin adenosyltransferase|nr:cob(I)yrinic acid a,c-diamide adenosyltransferase [Methanomassiliicoccaceae archaeon]
MKADENVKKELGLVQVYTGNGKGKTTAALGLTMRALGNNLNVAMVQFMKPDQGSGEYVMSKKLENFTLLPHGLDHLVDPRNITDDDREMARGALRKVKEMLYSGKYDLFVIDEINVAMGWKLVDVNEVIDMLRGRPKNVEVVLTGRYAPDEIIEFADLVTEMRMIKHPYDRGIGPRKGIES